MCTQLMHKLGIDKSTEIPFSQPARMPFLRTIIYKLYVWDRCCNPRCEETQALLLDIRTTVVEMEYARILCKQGNMDPDYAALRKAVNSFLGSRQAANKMVLLQKSSARNKPLQFLSEHVRIQEGPCYYSNQEDIST